VTYRGPAPKLKQFRAFDVPGIPGGFKPVDFPFVDAEGRVQGAFVYVKRGLEGRRFPVPDSPAVIYQTGLMYEPRVLGVRVGQALEFRNLDNLLHVAHPVPMPNREHGRAQPLTQAPQIFVFDRTEVMISVHCDVHPWMRAWVGVVEHPFFAISGEHGNFELGTLPAGKYTIGAWHERLAIEDREILVDGDVTMELTGVLK
jgi:hypothetical protein